MTDKSDDLKNVNGSGFPLQIAVEHLIRNATGPNNWSVQYVEHSWRNRFDEKSGFIDLVLANQYQTTTLVVECKRVQQAAWLFMRSDGTDRARRHCKAWVSRYADGGMKYFGWHDLTLEPACVEAMYCVTRGQSDSNPMLERIAADVVSSTEALAWEERDFRPAQTEHTRFYFSVILTTAELKVCSFQPGQISIKDGLIPEAEFTTFKTVPYIRFRKQLSSRVEPLTPEDFISEEFILSGNHLRKKEHTVFVVNTSSIIQFLSEMEIDGECLRRFVSG